MLDALITGKTRIKLLLRFFLNPATSSYLREIASEFNESTNSIRIELQRLAEAGLLREERRNGRVYYEANTDHPLFSEIHSIVQKTMGIDKLMDGLIKKVGTVKRAFIVGEYAKGVDCGLVDLVLVGGKIDVAFLHNLASKVEGLIDRKIRYLVLQEEEEEEVMKEFEGTPTLLLWNEDVSQDDEPRRQGSGFRALGSRGGPFQAVRFAKPRR
jgi:predicted transcriptional regulator